MTRLTFLIAYLAALPLTYVLPYFGSNSILAAVGTLGISLVGTLVHLACFAVMLCVAFQRGKAISRPLLWALPAGALCFDFIPLLSLIPLVPTVFHAAALVVGAHFQDKQG